MYRGGSFTLLMNTTSELVGLIFTSPPAESQANKPWIQNFYVFWSDSTK